MAERKRVWRERFTDGGDTAKFYRPQPDGTLQQFDPSQEPSQQRDLNEDDAASLSDLIESELASPRQE